jgi:hypothetical protein
MPDEYCLQGVVMTKLRPGIEIPIIPEDFIDCEKDDQLFKTSFQWTEHTQEPDSHPVEWLTLDSILLQYSES